MGPVIGIEPTFCDLRNRRFTIKASPAFPNDRGRIRTLDSHFVRVVPCQLGDPTLIQEPRVRVEPTLPVWKTGVITA